MSCLCSGSPDALLICNGFKDAEYVSLALVAKKLHFNSVIVLEEEDELDAGRKLGIRPLIGLRAKLRTKHAGHFGSTSGEKDLQGRRRARGTFPFKKEGHISHDRH
ncbi:arginine decarboxylase-like [Salvia splendens]|uniref:arginine decarboxylase-like n=1 Tax=Salvia splendens TaxID=180675 RepID=UPI001C276036|nr:arginine decarboxylase-like [Salvia splendens]